MRLQGSQDNVPTSAHMRLYDQRATEMRPLTLKKPSNESPVKLMRRQDSDVSIPPSFRMGEESQLHTADRLKRHSTRLAQQSLLKSTHTHINNNTIADDDDELGQTIRCLDPDEVLQETMPNKTVDSSSAQARNSPGKGNNLFGYAQSPGRQEKAEEQQKMSMEYETECIMEGPLRPLSATSLSPRGAKSASRMGLKQPVIDEASREATIEELGITSPHFNQDVFQFQDEDEEDAVVV